MKRLYLKLKLRYLKWKYRNLGSYITDLERERARIALEIMKTEGELRGD